MSVRDSDQLLDYSGFACPQAELDDSFLNFVIIEHGRQAIELFLSSFDVVSQSLRALLLSWLDNEARFDDIWNLAFGELLSVLLRRERPDVPRAVSRFVLRLHEMGLGGNWEIELNGPSRFCFDRWLLPTCDAIKVSAFCNEVSISLKGVSGEWSERTFRRSLSAWSCDYAPALPVLNTCSIYWPILTSECVTSSVVGIKLLTAEAYSSFIGESEKEANQFLGVVTDALRLIETYAPIYSSWVTRVVRNLLPLPVKQGVINGASAYLAPGVLSLSNQPDPLLLAEFLVHEGSHQYLYMLSRLGPLHDGTDNELHYSPFKNQGRPLLYIVLTYHAFGNVLLFYRMIQSGRVLPSLPQSNIDQRIELLQRNLAVLEDTLRSSHSLTPIGNALWIPICERLHG